MDTLELIFTLVGVVGFVFLLASFAFGELGELTGDNSSFAGDTHSVDVVTGHGLDMPSPEWHDLKVIAAGMVGFGAFGFIATNVGLPSSFAMIIACVGFIGTGAGALFGLLKPLARQQSTSLISRSTYVGQLAKVVVPMSSEQFGLVELLDSNNARVRVKAWSEKDELPRGSDVLIYEVEADCVRVMPAPHSLTKEL